MMTIKCSIISITRHNLLVTRTLWGKGTTNRHALGIKSMLIYTAQKYFSFITYDLIIMNSLNKYYNIKYKYIFLIKKPTQICTYILAYGVFSSVAQCSYTMEKIVHT